MVVASPQPESAAVRGVDWTAQPEKVVVPGTSSTRQFARSTVFGSWVSVQPVRPTFVVCPTTEQPLKVEVSVWTPETPRVAAPLTDMFPRDEFFLNHAQLHSWAPRR